MASTSGVRAQSSSSSSISAKKLKLSPEYDPAVINISDDDDDGDQKDDNDDNDDDGSTTMKLPFFTNPYIDYEFGNTFGTHLRQIKVKILTLVEVILNNAEQRLNNGDQNIVEDCDGGLYSGLGGISYMFLHLVLRKPDVLSAEEIIKMAPIVQKLLNTQLLYYAKTRQNGGTCTARNGATDKRPDDESQRVGFLVGDAGIFAVAAVLAKILGNEAVQNQCLKEFLSAAQIAQKENFHRLGSNDLFYGRCGYLTAALWLHQYLGYQPVPSKDLFKIWKCIVKTGRSTAKALKSPYPLAFTFNGKQYIGAAHGLCSILQILLSWPKFLADDATAEKDIKKTLDYFFIVCFPKICSSINPPLCMEQVKLDQKRRTKPNSTEPLGEDLGENIYSGHRLQWCYGLPGMVYLLAKAGLHYKNHEYLKACVKCADIIWAHGLIRKGPGLCHGIAGNAYVFLLLYRLTEYDPKYLFRALRFGEFIFSSQYRQHSEFSAAEHPYSLFTGISGSVCFLSDLLRPKTAEFPFLNVFFDSSIPTQVGEPISLPTAAVTSSLLDSALDNDDAPNFLIVEHQESNEHIVGNSGNDEFIEIFKQESLGEDEETELILS